MGSSYTGETAVGFARDTVPWPTQVRGGIKFVAISAGDAYTCALAAAAEAFRWGAN